ncbi:hypothetical protein OHB26_24860 [Nocardia sp. NBC_01503]|uniref:hypothetical protein n=1 Tax=Nocardia sp. NBC_01503 TaxID=2975997 RepID=UPI002E7C10B7|nr:hypothetical protein [Nocardia sp. NBC_01503]WTL30168.1 hypothetical protein OHB26_24860 [Nocardia sp. NBC_01503]
MSWAAVTVAMLAIPVAAAASASAAVDNVNLTQIYTGIGGCEGVGNTCTILVLTSGADALAPVTVTLAGQNVGTFTPQAGSKPGTGTIQYVYRSKLPEGVYNLTATQGSSTKSMTMQNCGNQPTGSSSASAQCTGNDILGALLMPLAILSGSGHTQL